MKEQEKKKLISHIKSDSKEFRAQLKDDQELKKYVMKAAKKVKKK